MNNNRLRFGVAVLGVAFVIAIALGATGVLTPKSQRTALGASTTLAIISGDVQVRHGAAGTFAPADDGMVLAPGDTVRTGADARAVLTYFEGSTVEIEPGSELAIEVAHGNPDGTTVIEMRQQLGSTWHVVTHLVQGGSKYEVHTTASTASVRGTQFAVGVETDQTTSVTTTEGRVIASDAGATKAVDITPGLTTTTKVNEKPEDPKPAPEPERKVTVTVGDQNTLVVDAFGRANGIKDGKKIVQTPGAQVEIVNGKMVVTMPNVPDGDVATHFQDKNKSEDIEVTTKVEDKGKKAVEITEKVKPSETAVTGVELKKTSGTTGASGASGATGAGTNVQDNTPTLKLKRITDIKGPKVGEIPKTPTTDDQQKAAEAEKNQTEKGSGFVPAITTTKGNASRTPEPTSNDNTSADKGSTTTGSAGSTGSGGRSAPPSSGSSQNGGGDDGNKTTQAPRSGFTSGAAGVTIGNLPNLDEQKRAAEQKAAEQKAAEEAAKQKAAEEKQKAAEAAKQKAAEDKQKQQDAEEAQKKAAEAAAEAAKKAAEAAAADAARKAEEAKKAADEARRTLPPTKPPTQAPTQRPPTSPRNNNGNNGGG